jgi:hypothetical protein
MKFILLQNYAPTETATEPITGWAPEDAAAHIEFQRRMNDRLTENGELVEAQALTGPEAGVLSQPQSRRIMSQVVTVGERPGQLLRQPYAQ